jgi:hypothetical protein
MAIRWFDAHFGVCRRLFVTLTEPFNPQSRYWKARLENLLNRRNSKLAAIQCYSFKSSVPHGRSQFAPAEIAFVTLHDRGGILDCDVHLTATR